MGIRALAEQRKPNYTSQRKETLVACPSLLLFTEGDACLGVRLSLKGQARRKDTGG